MTELSGAVVALDDAAHRDPEHVAERIALYAADRLAESARTWATEIRMSRPDATRDLPVEERQALALVVHGDDDRDHAEGPMSVVRCPL